MNLLLAQINLRTKLSQFFMSITLLFFDENNWNLTTDYSGKIL